MKVSSVKIGAKVLRRKYHKHVKISAVSFSKGGTTLSALPTAGINIEIDDRRYHIVIECCDFGVAQLTDYLQDVVKSKPLTARG